MNEELKKVLESDEGKAAIKAATDAAIEGLKTKNTELLGKLAKSKEQIGGFEERVTALEAEKAKAKDEAVNASGDIEKITQHLKETHANELAELTAKLELKDSQLNKHVVGGGLTAALVKAGVSAGLMPAAEALIKAQYKAEVAAKDDGSPFAKVNGLSVDEFVGNWAKSESGKHFVTAAQNAGGGSNGANGAGEAGGAKTMARSEFEALDVASRQVAMKEGTVLVDNVN